MKNVAIIGSGISGLTTAYLLSQKHQISVFEKNDYIGGHTATVNVEVDKQNYQIDTGFIVFNNKTYPNFLKLLQQIGIDKQKTEMSFSVKSEESGLEYNGHNLNTMFAQRRNILNPKFWCFIREILRFNKLCKQALLDNQCKKYETLGKFLIEKNFSYYFSRHYILPMGAAIWSSSIEQMQAFEFEFFVRFFENHGLLNVADRPQWYVIPGGSKQYIEPLIKNFRDHIHLNSNIDYVKRVESGVELHFENGEVKAFDDVVFACHSDQALRLLSAPSEAENKVLSGLKYKNNSVILHTDSSVLPKRKKAWASWNYNISHDQNVPACVTYNMNILQGIQSKTTFCVTLNQDDAIDKNKVLRQFNYEHPVFNAKSLKSQHARHEISGVNNTYFVGAYWYSGFHEDGVRSAVDVAKQFDCEL